MLKIYKHSLKSSGIKELRKYERGCWIRVVEPTKTDIAKLLKALPSLDFQTINDALDDYEMPRIERGNGAVYILVRIPVNIKGNIKTTPLLYVVTKENILTIENTCIEFMNLIAKGRYKDVYTTQRSRFLLSTFVEVSREYAFYAEGLARETKLIKQAVKKLTQKDIIKLIEIEEALNDFITSLIPTINAFERILSGKYLALHENDQELVNDLIIEYQQSLTICKTTVRSTQNIRDAYSAILNFSLNKVIKFLTSFTIILTIPTVVASIYGMNVRLPFANNLHAFSIVMLMTAGLVGIVFYIFYKNDWF